MQLLRRPTSLQVLLTSLRSPWRIASERQSHRTFRNPTATFGLYASRTYRWTPPNHQRHEYGFFQRQLLRPGFRRFVWTSLIFGYFGTFALGFYVRGKENWLPSSILGFKILKDRPLEQKRLWRIRDDEEKLIRGDIVEWITQDADEDEDAEYDDSQRSFTTMPRGKEISRSASGRWREERASVQGRTIMAFSVVYTTGQGWDIDVEEGESLRFDFQKPASEEHIPFTEKIDDRFDMRYIESATVHYSEGEPDTIEAKDAHQVHVSVVKTRSA